MESPRLASIYPLSQPLFGSSPWRVPQLHPYQGIFRLEDGSLDFTGYSAAAAMAAEAPPIHCARRGEQVERNLVSHRSDILAYSW